MRCFLIMSSLVFVAFGGMRPACAQGDGRTNFLMILADDMGYGDLGCYGRKDIRTPNLDRLAKQGVRFTDHYANGAECTPTRAAFMTGRYQQHIGGLECAIGTGNVGRYDDAVRLRQSNDLGLPVEEPTISRMLHDAGYATAICGKWHLGYEPKFAPHRHGFDRTFYCIGGGMDYFHYLDTVAGYNLFRDGRPVSAEGYFTDLMTDDAIDFLKTRPKEKPFFLYLPYTCPHSPFQGPDDRQDDPLPLDSALWNQGDAPPDVYVAMIEHMDKRIGDVLTTLDQLALTDETVVIFAGDNGGTKSARNAPLRGYKGSTFEGGIRVPAIVRWPGRIQAGLVSDQPCLTFDFTRSIAEIAGAKVRPDRPLEGIPLLQHIANQSQDRDRILYWRKQRGEQVWMAVRQGNWKYVAEQTPAATKEYLFDLDEDIGESMNQKTTNPDRFNELRKLYRSWEGEVRRNRRGQPD